MATLSEVGRSQIDDGEQIKIWYTDTHRLSLSTCYVFAWAICQLFYCKYNSKIEMHHILEFIIT